MSDNLTPQNIKKAKDLLDLANKNNPGNSTWNDAENKLKNLLWSFWVEESPKKIRLKFYSSGIYDSVISIIKADTGKHMNEVLRASWALVEIGMVASDAKEQDKIETLTKGVDLGFIELAVRELHFKPLRYDGYLMAKAFMALTEPPTYSAEFTSRIISSGAPLACLEFIRVGGDLHNDVVRSNISGAIRTLSNVARRNIDAIKILPHIVDAVKPYLPLLTRDGSDELILIGFVAARLLIRIYGKDDSSKVILENPIILEFYPNVMRKLMDIGAANNYDLYNTYWKLGGIALDMSLISMSDTNKQLLVPVVPLMLEMMALHHNGDRDVLRHGVVFLSQVSFDESCLSELKKDQERVKVIQGIILSDTEFDKETLSLLGVVMNAVFPSSSGSSVVPTTTTSSAKRRSSAFQKAASLVFGSNTTTPQIQVMISYHQKSTGQHAQALVQLFKKRHFRVWVDYESMKGDIQEAMAEAVQSSDIIVVLVSMGYKESANCRMECQYAMKQNKPLLFLVCEQSYTSPTGWLGLIMGQRMWVGVFTPGMVEDKSDEVMRRLDETLKGDGSELTTTTTAAAAATDVTSGSATTTTTSSLVHHHNPTMGETITNLMQEIATLKEKVNEIDGLKTKLSIHEAKISLLEGEIVSMKGNKE
jgi:hypothetical protein